MEIEEINKFRKIKKIHADMKWDLRQIIKSDLSCYEKLNKIYEVVEK